jgi:hypothetical protein
MGAPGPGIEAADQPAAETLLDSFKTIPAAERRKHASVLNYWLSIRGDKEFPPLHDLDPLELSDAGPSSVLLELISGGHDAEVRHLGETLRFEGKVDRIIDAPSPSILSCIAKKLPIVAISRDFLAFEDEYEAADGTTRCWVTLLPLSAGGAWVDYVYALVSFDGEGAKAAKTKAEPAAKKAKAKEPEPEVADELPVEEAAVEEPTVEEPVAEEPVAEEAAATREEEPVEEAPEAQSFDPIPESVKPLPEDELAAEPMPKAKPGFSKLFDNLVGLTGFYGHGYKVEAGIPAIPTPDEESAEEAVAGEASEEPIAAEEPVEEAAEEIVEELAEEPAAAVEEIIEEPASERIPEAVADDQPVAEESIEEPVTVEETVAAPEEPLELIEENPAPVALEGALQNKLADVRAKADEARQAKLRANVALYDGLSAAYDFALDAEDAPEEYLRLVEAEGLKIQLRSPMRPVVKLAFNGLCDDSTIKQLEAVLAWALDNELPRGSLAEQIEAAGGIGPILTGEAKAA